MIDKLNLFWILPPVFLTLAITPFIRGLFLKAGYVDRSGNDPLKIHADPVALAGGPSLVLAFVFCFLLFSLSSGIDLRQFLAFLNAGLMIFLLGLADDLKPLPPKLRIIIHFLAGAVIFFSGIRLGLSLWWGLSFFLTLLFIAGSINAFNMVDGMDGLCTGMAFLSCMGFAFLAVFQKDSVLFLTAVILAGALMGMLPYNFYPAKVFLGDSGSGFLGCICGIMAVIASKGSISKVWGPLLILGVPLLDMAAAMIRRLVKGKAVFLGDRDHIYDLLLKKGMTQPKVWGIITLFQLALVFAGVILYFSL